ncbi:hypothetical protein ONS95_000853 [Cadophora gregata]|uniref:uncharacterized protein n=1 Tax=Cadophora gregata TaxID=51156 RepID=UPI0026DA764F|nr:uncharacterized protein ONS95_000853 [Cadophora gregata]KAK0128907.1 hypothetical protein ONS95_000853 [Cadophora gregata]
MDVLAMDDVLALTTKIAGYGGAIASVLTNHAISARKIPRGFEGAINILSATVSTLQQVSSHLSTEVAASPSHEKQCLSRQGLEYVQLIATECATTFVKIPSIMADACLDSKELKVKRKLEKKLIANGDGPKPDNDALQLNKAAFTEVSNWRLAGDPLEDVIERLHEIQLYLLLVHQVVSLGQLSWIDSSSQVNVKSIVDFHVRVTRTASLIGIRSPDHTKRSNCSSRDSSSDSHSTSTFSDCDSDTDSNEFDYKPKNYKKSSLKSPSSRTIPGRRGPPAPPPLQRPIARNIAAPPPPPPPPPGWVVLGNPKPAAPRPSPISMHSPSSDTVKPPAYSEDHETGHSGGSPCSGSSAVRVVHGSAKSMTMPTQTVYASKATDLHPEKAVSPEVKDGTTPTTLDPRLFKTNSNGLVFKIKSIFRSRQSLATEIQKSLGDSDSHLRAFIIRGHEMRLVPHSTFHSLESTHMCTILTQLNDNTWYKTFTTLNQVDHQTVERLVHPFFMGKMYERDIIALKVLQENKPNAWMWLLRDVSTFRPASQGAYDRVILAIMREQLIDGKPLPPITFSPRGYPPAPPPPPPGFGSPPGAPMIRPPPNPPNHHLVSKISDLSMPIPPPLAMPPSMPGPQCRRGPPGPPGFGPRSTSDKRPLTDHAATMALINYSEFILRPADPLNPSSPRTWARVAITPESAEHDVLHQRIKAFQQKGGNIIEKKLRMNDDQNRQLTRLMDELQALERDSARFEWCWAEISLYNDAGEILLMSQANSATATTIHLIAKRMPKLSCKPLDVYNSLMEPLPPLPRPQPPPPVLVMRPPSPQRKKIKNHRSPYISDSSGSDSDYVLPILAASEDSD